MQTCWPGDAGPLITWGLVVTRGPQGVAAAAAAPEPRHLPPAGDRPAPGHHALAGAPRRRARLPRLRAAPIPGQPFPIAVALGADPATILGAVTPVPDTLSEYQFAGLLRGSRTELVDTRRRRRRRDAAGAGAAPRSCSKATSRPPRRASPASASTACRCKEQGGYLHALEGPFGDHTGYYNEQDWFPVFEIDRLTHRRDPIYHSTYTGKPPDEPAVLGVALNEVFVPILQKQFPEIVDFYLPPEGCSYRMAVIVASRRPTPGHAKRLMFGVWSFLRQFMYTKFIVVTDDDVDIRDWKRSDLGHHHAHGPGARHHAGRPHADRLPRLRLAGQRPGRQDGAGRDQQVARRDDPRMGPADPHGRRRSSSASPNCCAASRDRATDRLEIGPGANYPRRCLQRRHSKGCRCAPRGAGPELSGDPEPAASAACPFRPQGRKGPIFQRSAFRPS